MNRKVILCLLATVFLPTVFVAEAQQAKKVPRVAYLGIGSALNPGPKPTGDGLARLGGLRQGLRELKLTSSFGLPESKKPGKQRQSRLFTSLPPISSPPALWKASRGQAGISRA